MKRWRLSDLSYIAGLAQNAYYQQRVATSPQALQVARQKATELERVMQQIQEQAKVQLTKQDYEKPFWS
jgi:hypothetical protein